MCVFFETFYYRFKYFIELIDERESIEIESELMEKNWLCAKLDSDHVLKSNESLTKIEFTIRKCKIILKCYKNLKGSIKYLRKCENFK